MFLCDFTIISLKYNTAYCVTIIGFKCTLFYKKLRLDIRLKLQSLKEHT